MQLSCSLAARVFFGECYVQNRPAILHYGFQKNIALAKNRMPHAFLHHADMKTSGLCVERPRWVDGGGGGGEVRSVRFQESSRKRATLGIALP